MATYRGCPVSPSGELTTEFRELLGQYLDDKDSLPEPRDWRGFAMKIFEGLCTIQQIKEFDRLSKCDAIGPRSPTHEVLKKYMTGNGSIYVALLWNVLHNELGREDIADQLVNWHYDGRLLRDPDALPFYDQIKETSAQSNPTSGCDCSEHHIDAHRQQGGPGDSPRGTLNDCNEHSHGLNKGGAPSSNPSPEHAVVRRENRQRHEDEQRSLPHNDVAVRQKCRPCRQAAPGRPRSTHSGPSDIGGHPPVEDDCPLGASAPSYGAAQRPSSHVSSRSPSSQQELASEVRLDSEPQLSREHNDGLDWASDHWTQHMYRGGAVRGGMLGRPNGNSWHSEGHQSMGTTSSFGMGSEDTSSHGPRVDFSQTEFHALLPTAGEVCSVAGTVGTHNTAEHPGITRDHRVGITFHPLDLALAQRLERNLKKCGCRVTLLNGLSVLKTKKMDAVVVVYSHHYKRELYSRTVLLFSSIRSVYHDLYSEYRKHKERNQRAVFYPSFDVKGHMAPILFRRRPERWAAREVFNSLFVPKSNSN